MDQLTQCELRAIVEFLSNLHAVDTVDAFTRAVIHGIRHLVPSVVAGDNVIDREGDHIDWVSELREVAQFPHSQEILSRHIADDHPALVHARRTGADHWRSASDAELIARLKQDLDLFERAFEALDTGVIALGPTGRIRAATATARALLSRYCGLAARGDDELPEPIGAWVRHHVHDLEHPPELPSVPPSPLVVDGGEAHLVARIVYRGGQRLLLLTDRRTTPPSLVSRDLTRREIEVLQWVAEGKTNPEIAVILGLSRITVQHHLERVYRKLGVETRTAAAVWLRDAGIAFTEPRD